MKGLSVHPTDAIEVWLSILIFFLVQMCGNVVEYQLLVSLEEIFPSMEYVVRAGWIPDGDR